MANQTSDSIVAQSQVGKGFTEIESQLMTVQDKDQRIAVAVFIAVVIVAGVLI